MLRQACTELVEVLSTNGRVQHLCRPQPFAPVSSTGQALSLSKGNPHRVRQEHGIFDDFSVASLAGLALPADRGN